MTIESFKHKNQKRAHIPSKEEAGYETTNPVVQAKKTAEYPVNPIVQRGQDPELFWLDKYGPENLQEVVEVDIRSLYRYEHISPTVLMQNFYRLKEVQTPQMLLLNDLFGNALERDELEKVSEYYQHADGWTNRLIQGDSLLVMSSLLEREGMAGKVQMIYLDPPYGIKYGSNWQLKMNDRNVKDGDDEALTGEPEQIRAFRDTWELGVHSYLSYLRDRLVVARELLTESGSCFVQISDENVHLVRNVMDEVFGSGNFVNHIAFRKTTPLGAKGLAGIYDHLIWYARNKEVYKFHKLFKGKNIGSGNVYDFIELPDGGRRRLSAVEKMDIQKLPTDVKLFSSDKLTSSGYTQSCLYDFQFEGKTYKPTGKSWRTNLKGMQRLISLKRIIIQGNTPRFVLYFDDFPMQEINDMWEDTFGASNMEYVVQTSTKVIQRCLLMTTDPGDLVLDPTCVRKGTRVFVVSFGEQSVTPPSPPARGGERSEPVPGEEPFTTTNPPARFTPPRVRGGWGGCFGPEDLNITPPSPPARGGERSEPVPGEEPFTTTNPPARFTPPRVRGGWGGLKWQLTPIETLTSNDYVLTHEGEPQRVLRIIKKRFTGRMIGIRHQATDTPLWLTHDHRVLIRNRRYTLSGNSSWQHNANQTFEKARKLRNDTTLAEKILWGQLKSKQLNVKFRRQHPFGYYIVDFFCPQRALIVEIDGDSHFNAAAQAYDAERTRYLAASGLTVIRFTNAEIYDNLANVLETIQNHIGEPATHFHEEAIWIHAECLRIGDIVYWETTLQPVPIIDIQIEETSEEVYDLEVEHAHSFLTETCAVHNCGSGTTAYVAEQWGRRWITVDTSRIALNIAKIRLMTATFPYYPLQDEQGKDLRHGFQYKTVPHITLKSLANDEPPDTETLYDQPVVDNKKLRVAGEFTVETLQSYEPIAPEELEQEKVSDDFEQTLFEHLKTAGIKTGLKDETAVFIRLEHLNDAYLHAEGYYQTPQGEKKAYLHIGPKFGSVSKVAVNDSLKACRSRGDADWLIILGFSFDSDISNQTVTTRVGRFEVTKVRMHDDLLQTGLRKKDKKAGSFITIGEPEVKLHPNKKDKTVQVEICGLDIYDPIKDMVLARSLYHIAYWMVDDDYDDSNFVAKQIFFCGGDKDEFSKWRKGLGTLAKSAEVTRKNVQKTLKIEIDEEAFERVYGHLSHPITITKAHQKIAVRVVSQFGEESTKVCVV